MKETFAVKRSYIHLLHHSLCMLLVLNWLEVFFVLFCLRRMYNPRWRWSSTSKFLMDVHLPVFLRNSGRDRSLWTMLAVMLLWTHHSGIDGVWLWFVPSEARIEIWPRACDRTHILPLGWPSSRERRLLNKKSCCVFSLFHSPLWVLHRLLTGLKVLMGCDHSSLYLHNREPNTIHSLVNYPVVLLEQ